VVTDIYYKLSITSELEPLRGEIEYVCDFVEDCHNIERTTNSHLILHYGNNPPDGAIHIPSIIFPAAISIDENGIHLDHNTFSIIEKDNLSAIIPSDCNYNNNPHLYYDAIGIIFLMISRIEERDNDNLDNYNRFYYKAAFSVRNNIYEKPLADRAAYDIAKLVAGKNKLLNRTNYKIRLTHDVDKLKGYNRILDPIKNTMGDIFKRRNLTKAFTRIKDSYFSGAPWRSFKEIMALSEKYGHISHFYFIGPSEYYMDSPYAIYMVPLLRKIAKEVEKLGHNVGFHPGARTFDNPDLWNYQHSKLQEILDCELIEGRQHNLLYRSDITPDIWDKAGMKYDFTLGFPEKSGFRSGTCRPFRSYSLKNRKKLNLLQSSTAIMDFGLFGGKYRDLDLDTAINECLKINEVCKNFGGELVILYHTDWELSFKKMRNFYNLLLSEIS